VDLDVGAGSNCGPIERWVRPAYRNGNGRKRRHVKITLQNLEFQVPTLCGTSVTPASQACMVIMLLLLVVGN